MSALDFRATHRWRGTFGDPSERCRLVEIFGEQALVRFEGRDGDWRVAARRLIPIDECSCEFADVGTGETGPRVETYVDDDCPLHGIESTCSIRVAS